MSTDKQIHANRQNAQKATGPRTPEGKARSSQNAFKTGIDSKSEVIPTESRTEYEELIASFRAFYMAANPEEASFVDALIRHEWLSRRYICIESAIWTRRMADTQDRSMGRVFMSESNQIARAGQLYNASRRGFAAALKQLRKSQRLHADDPQPEEAAPESPAIAPKPLTPLSVSFLKADPPAIAPTNTQPETEETPPIAA